MKEFISTMTTKGRVTIPSEVRQHLQLRPHDKISFIIDEQGGVRLEAPRYPDIASVVGAAGRLREPKNWEDMQTLAREDRLTEEYNGKDS